MILWWNIELGVLTKKLVRIVTTSSILAQRAAPLVRSAKQSKAKPQSEPIAMGVRDPNTHARPHLVAISADPSSAWPVHVSDIRPEEGAIAPYRCVEPLSGKDDSSGWSRVVEASCRRDRP